VIRVNVALMTVMILCGELFAQLVFDDGGEHVLNGIVTDSVEVSNQSLLTVQAERIQQLVIDNAQVDYLSGVMDKDYPGVELSNSAMFNLFDGQLAELRLMDSEINIHQGSVLLIDASGMSTIRMVGGIVTDEHSEFVDVLLRDQSRFFMDGGRVVAREVAIEGHNSSDSVITDGLIIGCTEDLTTSTAVVLTEDASFTLPGGEIQCWSDGVTGVSVAGNAAFVMTGGKISARGDHQHIGIEATGHGKATLQGGEIFIEDLNVEIDGPRGHIVAHDESSIVVRGSDFTRPLGPIEDLAGLVRGRLADGTHFQWEFVRDPTARIVLVPEPSPLALLPIGAVTLLWCRKSRRKYDWPQSRPG
jgi:hypothetical protein